MTTYIDSASNNAEALVVSDLNDTTGSMTVQSGQESDFYANPPFNVIVYNSGDYSNIDAAYEGGAYEIVRVTNKNSNIFDITRAQENTIAHDFVSASEVKTAQVLTAKTISDINTHVSEYVDFSGSASTRLSTNETDINNLEMYSASLATNLNNLTDTEVTELSNINDVTITNTQWSYIGNLNQDLHTGSNVEFKEFSASEVFISSSATAEDFWTRGDTLFGVVGYDPDDDVVKLNYGDFDDRQLCINKSGSIGFGTHLPLERMHISGALLLGNTTSSNEGVIKYTGTDFEGYNGSSWISLTETGSSTADSASFSTRVSTNEDDISSIGTFTSSLATNINDLSTSEINKLEYSTKYIIKSSSYTASLGEHVYTNTSQSSWTLTLPSGSNSKLKENFVKVYDLGDNWGTNKLNVNGHGDNIDDSGSFECDVSNTDGANYEVMFLHNNIKWEVF